MTVVSSDGRQIFMHERSNYNILTAHKITKKLMQSNREKWNDLAQQLLPLMQKPGDFTNLEGDLQTSVEF